MLNNLNYKKEGVLREIPRNDLEKLVMCRDFVGRTAFTSSGVIADDLAQLLVLANLSESTDESKLRVEKIRKFLSEQFSDLENEISINGIENVLDAMFGRVLSLFPKRKDYIKDLDSAGKVPLKHNSTSEQISLFEELLELDHYQDKVTSHDKARELAYSRMVEIERISGLNEEQETKLENLAQAHRAYLKHRQPLSAESPLGYQMTHLIKTETPTGKKRFVLDRKS